MSRIGLGGGCHWCTEAVFQALAGVQRVEQGYIRAEPPADQESEGVILHFDPARIPLAVLIEVHLLTHASTADHALRHRYRSAIYSFGEVQAAEAAAVLSALAGQFEGQLQTQVLAYQGFRESPERFRNYYASNPQRPFCQNYIAPKLRLLMQRFATHLHPTDTASKDWPATAG